MTSLHASLELRGSNYDRKSLNQKDVVFTGVSAYFWWFSVHVHTADFTHCSSQCANIQYTHSGYSLHTLNNTNTYRVSCIQTHTHTFRPQRATTTYGRPTASCARSLVRPCTSNLQHPPRSPAWGCVWFGLTASRAPPQTHTHTHRGGVVSFEFITSYTNIVGRRSDVQRLQNQ